MAKAIAAAANPEDSSSGLQQVASGPKRLVEFLKETRQEMRKVVTPSRVEVKNMTIIVLVTVFLFAAYFELVDIVLGKGIDQIFLHLSSH
ncbi:MAG TPA: preprotein translocase subunit SecE [Candidatus Aquilonibacter sp.]|nr:preprotein translocase subunit SecE [Candidatus Aquilonibacter sp.]